MKNPFNHPAWTDISLLLARLVLGIVMVVAGWQKVRDVTKFVRGGFMEKKPDWLPEAIALPYGYAIPFLELLTGLLLVVGLFTRPAAGVMTLLLISIYIAVATAAGSASGGSPAFFHHSLVFATLSFLLMIIGPGRLALDPLYAGRGNSRSSSRGGKEA